MPGLNDIRTRVIGEREVFAAIEDAGRILLRALWEQEEERSAIP